MNFGDFELFNGESGGELLTLTGDLAVEFSGICGEYSLLWACDEAETIWRNQINWNAWSVLSFKFQKSKSELNNLIKFT